MTDSAYIQKYYKRVYGEILPVIPYGYSSIKIGKGILGKYELERGKYLIWTGRLVKDNHLEELLRAYSQAKIKLPLVVLGDSPNEEKYKKKLNDFSNDLNIKYLGFVDRLTYATLVASSRAYIETKRSGGTHPSLVESMGHGCFILCNDHRSHKDVLGDTALYYPKADVSELAKKLRQICENKFSTKREIFCRLTKERAKKLYSWDAIVESYEDLFAGLVN